MRPVDPIKAGAVLGIFGGAFHLGRVVLVELGWAQPIPLGRSVFR